MRAANKRMRLTKVATACSVQACENILQKAFRREGYSHQVARKKLFLDERKKGLRLPFAQAHQDWSREDWHWVIWTDECYIWLSGNPSRVWFTRRPGEEYYDNCLVLKFSKKNSIMVWSDILREKKCELVLWDWDNWGTITSRSYVDNVLTPVLQPFWNRESEQTGGPLCLIEDRASAQQTAYTCQVREGYGIPKFNWPPSSPVLSRPQPDRECLVYPKRYAKQAPSEATGPGGYGGCYKGGMGKDFRSRSSDFHWFHASMNRGHYCSIWGSYSLVNFMYFYFFVYIF